MCTNNFEKKPCYSPQATGPFYLSWIAILFISSIVLHFKLPKDPSGNNDDKVFVKCFLTLTFLIMLMPIFTWLASLEKFDMFLFMSVVQACIIQLYPTIYFLNHPNLKQYAFKTLQEWSKSKLIVFFTPDLTTWKNVFLLVVFLLTMGGCFGFLFEYKWPKAKNPNTTNRVSPV